MSQVVRLGLSDIDAYIRLREMMLADAPWAFGSSPGDDRGRNPEALRAGLSAERGAILAVKAGDELIAAAGVMREDKLKRRHLATVWGVFVRPEARGRGLGRAVVQGAIDVAREWPGVARVELSVSENAPAAQRVYEALGFVAWGREPEALRVDGVSYAEIHMSLPLG